MDPWNVIVKRKRKHKIIFLVPEWMSNVYRSYVNVLMYVNGRMSDM